MKTTPQFIEMGGHQKAGRHLAAVILIALVCAALFGCGGKNAGQGATSLPVPGALTTHNLLL